MKKLISFFLLISGLAVIAETQAQSFEAMVGQEHIFMDIQWLKPLSKDNKWTLFTRARATADYEERTNHLTGAYLNYTTKSGFGGTLIGSMRTSGAGGEAGIHYFKLTENFMFYGLPTIHFRKDLAYSWFSIMRYRPSLNEKLRLYTSLELFSYFEEDAHVASVQRIRLGLEAKKYQFGVAANLSGFGSSYAIGDENVGVFVRREF